MSTYINPKASYLANVNVSPVLKHMLFSHREIYVFKDMTANVWILVSVQGGHQIVFNTMGPNSMLAK